MTVFIGGAWPYANGSLHIGHISSLLPGDIIARYYRAKGEDVLYVSGSDCNGTPINIRAKQVGVSVHEIADKYHKEFTDTFSKLGFSYDCYTRTDAEHHHETVQDIFRELYQRGYIYTKIEQQAYCDTFSQFLPDRYVEGTCPVCGAHARGDQCDNCSTILDPLDLLERTCTLCGKEPLIKDTKQLYFKLSSFQEKLETYVARASEKHAWRENAIGLSKRYLNEGLLDRAVSRDLPNGVSVPIEGYEDKKIYVWIEAVSGYYSASKKWAEEHNKDVSDFWNKSTTSYYVHGKDNIPFHTIIWPAILLGLEQQPLPAHIVSNEYMTLERKKISTSKQYAVWAPYLIDHYDADAIRYFLTVNAPENRDTDFSWREFIYSHNSELLGGYGNFIHRTLKFIEKYFDSNLPQGEVEEEINIKLEHLYSEVSELIESMQYKLALERIFQQIRTANKYFDMKQPWKTIVEDKEDCKKTMIQCVHYIANFAQLLQPFLPFSSEKVKEMLCMNEWSWRVINCDATKLPDISPLFSRIDTAAIEMEMNKIINE